MMQPLVADRPPPPADVAPDTADIQEKVISSTTARKKRLLKIHLPVYGVVNTVIVVSWIVIQVGGYNVQVSVFGGPLPAGFFWPIFPIVIWGAIILSFAYSVYRRRDVPESVIRGEIQKTALVTTVPSKVTRGVPTPAVIERPTSKADPMNSRTAFLIHALVYLAINGLIVMGWASGGGGFFLPVGVTAGWGGGLVMHAYKVFWTASPSKENS